MTTESNGALVEIREVSKRFPGVHALDCVSIDIRPGTGAVVVTRTNLHNRVAPVRHPALRLAASG